jgi:hypothetical protein
MHQRGHVVGYIVVRPEPFQARRAHIMIVINIFFLAKMTTFTQMVNGLYELNYDGRI